MKMDIEKVARLARIELTQDEKKIFGEQMEQILNYMEKLNEVDTSGIEPTSHAIPLFNVFREDEPEKSFQRESVLKNAPEQEDGYFKVPRIIE